MARYTGPRRLSSFGSHIVMESNIDNRMRSFQLSYRQCIALHARNVSSHPNVELSERLEI
jgi:hypothetical protein